MRRMARAFGLLLVAALAVLGGCASPAPAQSAPPSATYTASLADLQDKVDAIAQDSCTTRPAVQAYPDCARYVAEVGNAALATQGAAASVTGARAAGGHRHPAGRRGGPVQPHGLRGRAGRGGPPAQACGDVLKKIQARPDRDAHPARRRRDSAAHPRGALPLHHDHRFRAEAARSGRKRTDW